MRIAHKEIDLESFQRPDGQFFKIDARLYDMPSKYDYWMASYDVEHDQWGHMTFTLTIPKWLSSDLLLAEALLRGDCLAHVKISLSSANQNGRDLAPIFSTDGWILL